MDFANIGKHHDQASSIEDAVFVCPARYLLDFKLFDKE